MSESKSDIPNYLFPMFEYESVHAPLMPIMPDTVPVTADFILEHCDPPDDFESSRNFLIFTIVPSVLTVFAALIAIRYRKRNMTDTERQTVLFTLVAYLIIAALYCGPFLLVYISANGTETMMGMWYYYQGHRKPHYRLVNFLCPSCEPEQAPYFMMSTVLSIGLLSLLPLVLIHRKWVHLVHLILLTLWVSSVCLIYSQAYMYTVAPGTALGVLVVLGYTVYLQFKILWPNSTSYGDDYKGLPTDDAM